MQAKKARPEWAGFFKNKNEPKCFSQLETGWLG